MWHRNTPRDKRYYNQEDCGLEKICSLKSSYWKGFATPMPSITLLPDGDPIPLPQHSSKADKYFRTLNRWPMRPERHFIKRIIKLHQKGTLIIKLPQRTLWRFLQVNAPLSSLVTLQFAINLTFNFALTRALQHLEAEGRLKRCRESNQFIAADEYIT